MNGLPYLSIIIVVGCAVFYARAARLENASAILWAGLSILTSVITLWVLGFGWMGCLLGQAALLAGITLVRVVRALREPAAPSEAPRAPSAPAPAPKRPE